MKCDGRRYTSPRMGATRTPTTRGSKTSWGFFTPRTSHKPGGGAKHQGSYVFSLVCDLCVVAQGAGDARAETFADRADHIHQGVCAAGVVCRGGASSGLHTIMKARMRWVRVLHVIVSVCAARHSVAAGSWVSYLDQLPRATHSVPGLQRVTSHPI